MVLLISLAIGLIIGYSNIINKNVQPLITKLFNIIFLAMLTLLGYKMFVSDEVTKNIGNIGLLAITFSVFICFCSVLITTFLIQLLQPIHSKKVDKNIKANVNFDLKEAVIPVMAIIIGSIIGLVSPNMVINHDRWIYWLMLSLIFGIGIDIGQSREELRLIKKIGWLGVIVPTGALIGSIIGSLLFGVFAGISPIVSMAIGAGSGFYSVTAPLVTQVAGAQYGALALITNFLRETFTITLLPIVALHFRHPALVTVGGATTMDTTLPVIARSLGSKTAMIGLVQGIILSLLVPVLVPIILGM